MTYYQLTYILSIDSIYADLGVNKIFLSTQSKKREVIAFLKDLKELLEKENFNIEHDLILIKKQKPNDEEHSTAYTLLDLDYDMWDVAERLKELTVSEYSETKIDKDNLDPPLLFVFGKTHIYKIENQREPDEIHFMRIIPLHRKVNEISLYLKGFKKEGNNGNQHINQKSPYSLSIM